MKEDEGKERAWDTCIFSFGKQLKNAICFKESGWACWAKAIDLPMVSANESTRE